VETVDFFPTEVAMPFQSSQDLATQAAKKLRYALLHPQPPEPFCWFDNDQILALEQLATIFEGDLPSHKSNTTPPPSRNR
jgi:hypothetical protein